MGVKVGVRTNAAELWPRIVDRLPVESQPEVDSESLFVYSLWIGPPPRRAGVRSMNVLYRNSARLARGAGLEEMLGRFERDLREIAVERGSYRILLRASGIQVGPQALLVLDTDPDLSTPFVREVLHRSGRLLADEVTPLDEELRLASTSPIRSLPAGAQLPPRQRIGDVVVPARGAIDANRVERLGRASAIVSLARSVLADDGTPGEPMRALSSLARDTAIWRVAVSDPSTAAAELLDRVSPVGRGL